MLNFIKKIWSPKTVVLSAQEQLAQWHANGKPAPPPHIVKQLLLQRYKQLFNVSILVETGTYLGDMMEAQQDHFETLYSIELSEALHKKAVKRFAGNSKITILQGDSGKVLHNLVPKLAGTAVFWLDGHYSAGVTARGEKDCPIFEELEAILNDTRYHHVILIDDARLFIGEGDYPTVSELTQFVHGKNSAYSVTVADDSICVIPT